MIVRELGERGSSSSSEESRVLACAIFFFGFFLSKLVRSGRRPICREMTGISRHDSEKGNRVFTRGALCAPPLPAGAPKKPALDRVKRRKMLFLPVAYLLQLLCQRCLNQWTSLLKRHHACFHVRNVSCAFHHREGIRSTLLGGVDNTFSLSICWWQNWSWSTYVDNLSGLAVKEAHLISGGLLTKLLSKFFNQPSLEAFETYRMLKLGSLPSVGESMFWAQVEAMALLVHGGKHMHCAYDKAEWCKVFMCSTSDTKLKKKVVGVHCTVDHTLMRCNLCSYMQVSACVDCDQL